MPRTNRPPKYALHRASKQAVVRIAGRDHYLGPHGSPESWAKYHRLLADHAATGGVPAPKPADPAPRSVTVAELAVGFWAHGAAHYRHPDGTPTGELGYYKLAFRPLLKLHADTPAADFGPLALRSVRDEMVRSGLSRAGVNARVHRIRRAFRWAASVELIPVAVVQALATVPGLQQGRTDAREADPVGPVALEVVEATLPHLPRPVAAMVRLQLLTGMRPGEACAMRGRDLQAGEPTWTYAPSKHKTAWRGKGRSIPLGPRAVEVVRPFLRADLEAYLFDPREAVAAHLGRTPGDVAGLGRHYNGRYTRWSYRRAIHEGCRKAGVEPWAPNQLRHAAATAIRARYGLEAAQVVLGHSRPDTTLIYAGRDQELAARVAREIG